MSFSAKCKNELARKVPEKECCRLAELSALIRMDGTIKLEAGQKISLWIDTENAAVARKTIKLIKNLFDIDTQTLVRRRQRLRKNNVYRVEVAHQPGLMRMLQQTGTDWIMGRGMEQWEGKHLDKLCCQKAYLRGAFLAAGSVNDPQAGSYHLEIVSHDHGQLNLLRRMINRFKLEPRLTNRKDGEMLYLKGAEKIIGFLSLVGAHSALLNFENIRIYKDIRNNVNRLVNCDSANLNKSVNAAARQIEAIQLIAAETGLDKLSPALRDIAYMRMENPDVSLKELGEMMDPPLGKSAVNHRIRRIEQAAAKYKR
ncbi:DNA-binding protein WhiA [Metallumcola ferriviriculae]|uniref:Probable cell division protein WhiA n=1 Tax=Metallumcola ferriviriculae TaxID=3039180 RepID=A0AAU0UL52_9FIRM|nr:DNA-binding protein WhiA [Desulfitibacteraceae bacterium MK1]